MAEPIKNILEGLIQEWGGEKLAEERRLQAAWREVVGGLASRHSQPVEFKKGRLVILIDTSSWFYQLSLFKRLIFKKLKRRLGESVDLKELIFRVGKLDNGQEIQTSQTS